MVFVKQQQKLSSVTVVVPATSEESASVVSPSCSFGWLVCFRCRDVCFQGELQRRIELVRVTNPFC